MKKLPNYFARITTFATILGLQFLSASVHAAISTPHDTIPDFAEFATISSNQSGNWSNAATWTPARLPGPEDIVAIRAGHTVTFDVPSAQVQVVGIKAGGL